RRLTRPRWCRADRPGTICPPDDPRFEPHLHVRGLPCGPLRTTPTPWRNDDSVAPPTPEEERQHMNAGEITVTSLTHRGAVRAAVVLGRSPRHHLPARRFTFRTPPACSGPGVWPSSYHTHSLAECR